MTCFGVWLNYFDVKKIYSFPSSVQSMYINIIRGYYYGNFRITWQCLLKPWKRKKNKANPEEIQKKINFCLEVTSFWGELDYHNSIQSFLTVKKQTNKKQISQIVFMFFLDRISSSNLLKLIIDFQSEKFFKNRFKAIFKIFCVPPTNSRKITPLMNLLSTLIHDLITIFFLFS